MRKAQLYVVDAFIAGIILFIGVGALFIAQSDAIQTSPLHTTLEDVKNLVFITPIEDLEIDYVQNNQDILEPSVTVMQQVQIWLETGCGACETQSQDFLVDLIDEVVPSQYGVRITYTDDLNVTTEVFNRPISIDQRVVLISEQIIYSRIGSTLYGPGSVEVSIFA